MLGGRDMRSNDMTHIRRDLAEWGEPIVADQLIGFYASVLKGQQNIAQPLAFNHRRLWRHLFSGHAQEAQNIRLELQRLGKLCGIRAAMIDDIDHQVIDELMNVIMARFHRSPSVARDYSLTLINIAESLAETRLRAA